MGYPLLPVGHGLDSVIVDVRSSLRGGYAGGPAGSSKRMAHPVHLTIVKHYLFSGSPGNRSRSAYLPNPVEDSGPWPARYSRSLTVLHAGA